MIPLVGCIMPCRNRPQIVTRAFDSFGRQTYARRRLLASNEPEHRPLGIVRNEMIAQLEPEVSAIAHWDDDDWSREDRLALAMAAIENGAELVGSSVIAFREEATKCVWRFDGRIGQPKDRPYILGGTFAYTRALWERLGGFTEKMATGEDGDFLNRARAAKAKVVDLADENLYTASIHPGNTCPKHVSDERYALLAMYNKAGCRRCGCLEPEHGAKGRCAPPAAHICWGYVR